jgi:hypothetical protein
MDPDQLLQSLGLSLDLPNLRFDGNGCARLLIDDAPALNFERDANGAIHLYSVLAPLPPDGREALFANLLRGNLFGESTAGASLAIDEPRGEILICRTVVAELMTGPAFVTMVEVFVDAAQNWAGRITHAPSSSASTAASFGAMPMLDHFMRG